MVLSVACGLSVAPAAPVPVASGMKVDLDGDQRDEVLVRMRVADDPILPLFQWAVWDRTNGRLVQRLIGPRGQALLPPRVRDLTNDGRPELVLPWHTRGNSGTIIDGVWTWSGSRAVPLWRSNANLVLRQLGVTEYPARVFVRFPDEDHDGVHALEERWVLSDSCRACPILRVLVARYAFSVSAGRYVFAGLREGPADGETQPWSQLSPLQ